MLKMMREIYLYVNPFYFSDFGLSARLSGRWILFCQHLNLSNADVYSSGTCLKVVQVDERNRHV